LVDFRTLFCNLFVDENNSSGKICAFICALSAESAGENTSTIIEQDFGSVSLINSDILENLRFSSS